MSPTEPAGQSRDAASVPAPARPLALAVLAATVLGYAWTARDLARGWVATDGLWVGLMVLAAIGFLIWDRRETIARTPVRPGAWGAVLAGAALGLLLLGTRASLVFGMTSVLIRGVSLLAFLWGAALLLWGPGLARHLALPTLLALFLFPENYVTAYWVPLRLQTLTAVLSERIVALLGNVVVREGHVLETPGFSANVMEACSGIRSLTTVVPTAIFLSAYLLRRPATRVALVLLAVPLTVLANVFRVSLTVLLGTHVGRRAAEGFFHYFAGLGIFLFCLAGLILLVRVLRHAEPAPDAASEDQPSPDPAADASFEPARILRARPLALLLALSLAGVAWQGWELYRIRRARVIYAPKPLEAIPERIDGRRGAPQPVDERTIALRKPSDVLHRRYAAPGHAPIDLVILYWLPEAGTMLSRRMHGPELCAPFHGLSEKWHRTLTLRPFGRDKETVEVHCGAFETGGRRILVTWWQQAGTEGLGRLHWPKGYFAWLGFGLKTLWRGELTAPEFAFQLVTPVAGAGEAETVKSHRRFAEALLADLARLKIGRRPVRSKPGH
jgi:exosortase